MIQHLLCITKLGISTHVDLVSQPEIRLYGRLYLACVRRHSELVMGVASGPPMRDADTGDGATSNEALGADVSAASELKRVVVEADTLSGACRGFLVAVVRILPRTPAVKFFAPKQRPEPTVRWMSWEFVRTKVTFMAAGSALFALHARSLAHVESLVGAEHDAVANTVVMHACGGTVGGAAHACVCAMAPGGLGWRRLPAFILKDAVGFAAFFSMFAVVHRRLHSTEHNLSTQLTPGRRVGGSIACSVTAGAIAGGTYHFITFPWERAVALAHTDTQASVLEVARRHGLRALYSGVTRTALSGVGVGAVTFAAYDVAMRELHSERTFAAAARTETARKP